jgi:arylsulfatase A-like enzyme
MRVPFIAAWAKPNADNPQQKRLPIPAGALQTQLASVCDLFPTILHFVGIESPRGYQVDGLRLDHLLSGRPDPNRPEQFLMHYPHAPHRSDYWTSYREGRWKVIYHYVPSAASENSHYQLFDLAADPFEQRNLSTSHPDELERLMKALIAALEAHDAVYPIDSQKHPQRPKLPTNK